ncbi:protein-glucosylgalactosylhydroxylysine glucosidase-like, partial [Lingula anatina]|uniref:Protein-glucosylgalactosylhydroxylysine glucosidase-like n=1 Tax=Lingula anatina TaxID=7574 RepID=A0A1S3JJ02_LINAN
MALAKKNQLYSNHVTAWNEVWKKGRIDVSDNKGLAKSVYGCLYYILSSLPLKEDTNWPFIGLSPGDLAHGAYKKDYEGHVFWDQETWMYPPIQMFFPDLAKIMLKTRTRTLDAARHNAIQKRLKGAKYPWESAFTGAETSPSNDTATYEIHINGDISLAVRQYLYSTWDVDFLKNEKGFDMVLGIADFWESRSVVGKGGKLEIHSVDGPDEYHFNVNNSVYTNYVAKI